MLISEKIRTKILPLLQNDYMVLCAVGKYRLAHDIRLLIKDVEESIRLHEIEERENS